MKGPVRLMKRKIDLKKNYLLRIETGLILSLTLFLIAFRIDYNPSEKTNTYHLSDQEEIFIEEIVQTKQEIKAPPPPRPAVPIEVPNEMIIEDVILNIDAELNLDDMIELPPPPPPSDKEEIEEEIFIVVEQPPVLIGGIESIQKRIIYPDLAIQAGIEGRVIVQFVIDKDGEIYDPVVVRGIGGGCDEEAIRAVKLAHFKPGLQRGKPVSVRYTIPVMFKLKSNDN